VVRNRYSLNGLREQGPIQTCRAFMKKLDTHSPLGEELNTSYLFVGARFPQKYRAGHYRSE
jgi:hypothetical protein